MKFQIDFSGQFRWSSLHRAIPAVPFSAHAALSTRSRSRMLKWRIQSSEPESTQKLLRPDDCCRTENRIWNAIVNSMKYIQAKSCCISRYCSEISVWQAYFHSHLYPQMAQRIDIPYLKKIRVFGWYFTGLTKNYKSCNSKCQQKTHICQVNRTEPGSETLTLKFSHCGVPL